MGVVRWIVSRWRWVGLLVVVAIAVAVSTRAFTSDTNDRRFCALGLPVPADMVTGATQQEAVSKYVGAHGGDPSKAARIHYTDRYAPVMWDISKTHSDTSAWAVQLAAEPDGSWRLTGDCIATPAP